MSLYLQHYFDPDFDHQDLRPTHGALGETDRYNLGYVQNVSKGQILAELVPLESVNEPLPRFTQETSEIPGGVNTRVDPAYPQYLLADTNGYVFYYEDKIVVKRLLNVRRDVDFHTGNIFFVGDAVFHANIKPGFEVQANNILVNGIVEGGEVRARNDLKVEGGARGGANNRCLLDSGGGLRVSFVEKSELRSRGKTIIDRFCAHSSLYVAGDLIVNDLLFGGCAQVSKYMLVKGNLGNKALVSTKVFLGYDPFIMRELEQCDKRLAVITERINHYKSIVGHLPPDSNDLSKKLSTAQKKRQMLLKLRDNYWKVLHQNEAETSTCRLIVLGTVYPGVEIAIGRAYYTVTEPMQGVVFKLEENDIVTGEVPMKVHKFFNK